MLIDGVFLGGPCDSSVPKNVVRNPWNARVIGAAAEGGLEHVHAAIASSRAALPGWASLPMRARCAILAEVAKRIRDQRQELAELLVQEISKPITLALAEVDRTAITFQLSSELAEEASGIDISQDPRAAAFDVYVQRFPIGVVTAFSPYNWPYNLAAHKIGPALAAGCAVILKGSPLASLATAKLVRLIQSCGLPAGVLNSVQCDHSAAQALAVHAGVDALSFTGSPKVGWHLKSLLPVKPVTLELGGNAFAIVTASADLEQAARFLAFSAFAYAGQICISLQHVLVEEAVYPAFLEAFLKAAEAISAADPSEPATICSCLIHEEAAQKVQAMVESSGGKVLLGGAAEGNRYPPTVVEISDFREAQAAGVSLCAEEAFGPVVTVSSVASLATAAELVNASKYGIHASLMTQSEADIESAYRMLNVSGLVVNDGPTVRFDAMPYGGQKESGFGREGVKLAYDFYSVPRVLVRRKD